MVDLFSLRSPTDPFWTCQDCSRYPHLCLPVQFGSLEPTYLLDHKNHFLRGTIS